MILVLALGARTTHLVIDDALLKAVEYEMQVEFHVVAKSRFDSCVWIGGPAGLPPGFVGRRVSAAHLPKPQYIADIHLRTQEYFSGPLPTDGSGPGRNSGTSRNETSPGSAGGRGRLGIGIAEPARWCSTPFPICPMIES